MKILLAVKSCWSYKYQKSDEGAAHKSGVDEYRARAPRETWYKDWKKYYQDQLTVKFFYGTPTGDITFQENSITLDCPDDYDNLPRKTQKIMEWAYENEYSNVMLVDDDVYIWMSRLITEIKSWQTPPTYRGHANGWFASGAAYWVDTPAMKLIISEKWRKDDTTMEDQFCGKTLGKYGIVPEHDERYHVCPCDVCLKKIDTEKRITQLTSTPKMMFDLHNATVRLIQ